MDCSEEDKNEKNKTILKNYDKISDEDIVSGAIENNGTTELEFIINKYKNFVKLKSKTYFLIGAEKDDVFQEGMIGLFKAVQNFNSSKSSSFKNFAEICIRRQIITAIKTANRKKHIPLNSYISLNNPQKNDDEINMGTNNMSKESQIFDPQEVFSCKELFSHIKKQIGEILSGFEKKVFIMYIKGLNYQEIASQLNKTPKSVDNAIQRAKRKMGKFKKIICD